MNTNFIGLRKNDVNSKLASKRCDVVVVFEINRSKSASQLKILVKL